MQMWYKRITDTFNDLLWREGVGSVLAGFSCYSVTALSGSTSLLPSARMFDQSVAAFRPILHVPWKTPISYGTPDQWTFLWFVCDYCVVAVVTFTFIVVQ